MLEIILLIVLSGTIRNMARRRGRSPFRFTLLLIICWYGGAFFGDFLGATGSRNAATGDSYLQQIGFALCGAFAGGGLAFLIAGTLGPVDGVWRNVAKTSASRSRLVGAVVGGMGDGVFGAIVVYAMYDSQQTDFNIPIVVQGFLAAGFIGVLLGMVSGVEKSEPRLSGRSTQVSQS